jgi:hypothetical protein
MSRSWPCRSHGDSAHARCSGLHPEHRTRLAHGLGATKDEQSTCNATRREFHRMAGAAPSGRGDHVRLRGPTMLKPDGICLSVSGSSIALFRLPSTHSRQRVRGACSALSRSSDNMAPWWRLMFLRECSVSHAAWDEGFVTTHFASEVRSNHCATTRQRGESLGEASPLPFGANLDQTNPGARPCRRSQSAATSVSNSSHVL